MDNIAHTLAGAALGQAGLKRRTGLGMATLMIAANLPDLDGLGIFLGHNLAWRRGWTHGPIALLLLPILLTLAIVWFDRWQARRGKRPAKRAAVLPGQVLALAYIGILTHPLLDFLNTYGIRFLMPFSDRWFYGDALFIIDLVMWIGLALGIWLAVRRWRRGLPSPARPAIAALVLTSLYAGAMMAGGRHAEALAAREAVRLGHEPPRRVLASPVPLSPLRRDIVVDLGHAYLTGDFAWTPAPSIHFGPAIPVNMDDPAIGRAAARHREIADFLYWSRYPFAEIERRPGAALVTIGDARYHRVPSSGFIRRALVPEPD